jgi:hypothetical protein
MRRRNSDKIINAGREDEQIADESSGVKSREDFIIRVHRHNAVLLVVILIVATLLIQCT